MRAAQLALRLLGFGRRKPRTRLGKALRCGELVLCALVAGYTLLFFFPQVLFAYSLSTEAVAVYSTEPIPEAMQDRIAQVRSRLARSSLSRDEDRFSVFLCNGKPLYAFFSPAAREAFAAAHPLTHNIFIADGDAERDVARAFRADHNCRSLAAVAAHEAGHVLLFRRFGRIAEWRMPRWLKEGYCEWLAGDSSFPESEGDRLLAGGGNDPSPAFRYLLWRRMVEYLLGERGLTIEELVVAPPDPQEVEAETRTWLARTRAMAP